MKIRDAIRDAHCRGCGCDIERGKEMLSMHPHWSRDSTLQFCFDCVDRMTELLESYRNPKEPEKFTVQPVTKSALVEMHEIMDH